jgi:hypothetical protein
LLSGLHAPEPESATNSAGAKYNANNKTTGTTINNAHAHTQEQFCIQRERVSSQITSFVTGARWQNRDFRGAKNNVDITSRERHLLRARCGCAFSLVYFCV